MALQVHTSQGEEKGKFCCGYISLSFIEGELGQSCLDRFDMIRAFRTALLQFCLVKLGALVLLDHGSSPCQGQMRDLKLLICSLTFLGSTSIEDVLSFLEPRHFISRAWVAE